MLVWGRAPGRDRRPATDLSPGRRRIRPLLGGLPALVLFLTLTPDFRDSSLAMTRGGEAFSSPCIHSTAAWREYRGLEPQILSVLRPSAMSGTRCTSYDVLIGGVSTDFYLHGDSVRSYQAYVHRELDMRNERLEMAATGEALSPSSVWICILFPATGISSDLRQHDRRYP